MHPAAGLGAGVEFLRFFVSKRRKEFDMKLVIPVIVAVGGLLVEAHHIGKVPWKDMIVSIDDPGE